MTPSSPHAPDNFPLRLTISRAVTQTSHATEIAHHVLGLAKVDLLQQIAHFELHILYETTDVGNVTVVVVYGQILLHLARHVPAEIHVAERSVCSGQRQDDCGGELVVRVPASLNGFKNVNRVPDSLGGATRCSRCVAVLADDLLVASQAPSPSLVLWSPPS